MATFRFEAMDSKGETQRNQIQAVNTDEAMSMLRSRGLFVTALSEVVAQSTDGGMSSQSMAAQPESVATTANGAVTRQPRHVRRLGISVTAVGLICAVFGLYGAIDSFLFGIGAQRVNATVAEVDHTAEVSSDVLEFTASGREYRVIARGSFGVVWGPSRGMKSRLSIQYASDCPEDARLAGFVPRFAIPLILLVLGFMFTPAGVLVFRYGSRPD